MTALFDRRCVVLLGEAPRAGQFVLATPDALRIEGLRVAFKVTRDLKPEPNTAEISIVNLSPASRGAFVAKGARVVLLAGYPDATAQIFSGDVRTFAHEHQGPDVVTKLTAGDGERAYAHARVSASFRPGVSVGEVVGRTARALASDPTNALAVAQNMAGQFASGYVQHAQASTELTRLLAPRGFSWSIQDGRVEILGPGGALADEGPLLSPETGLIGSPTLAAPEDAKKRPTMTVRSLLQPGLRPGQRFSLRVADERPPRLQRLSGTYRAEKVTHHGDTHGGDWYTDVEVTT